jgi:hypothetical protein
MCLLSVMTHTHTKDMAGINSNGATAHCRHLRHSPYNMAALTTGQTIRPCVCGCQITFLIKAQRHSKVRCQQQHPSCCVGAHTYRSHMRGGSSHTYIHICTCEEPAADSNTA